MKKNYSANHGSSRPKQSVSVDVSHGSGASHGAHEEIALLAHGLWQARGCPYGSPDKDWFQADQEFRTRELRAVSQESVS